MGDDLLLPFAAITYYVVKSHLRLHSVGFLFSFLRNLFFSLRLNFHHLLIIIIHLPSSFSINYSISYIYRFVQHKKGERRFSYVIITPHTSIGGLVVSSSLLHYFIYIYIFIYRFFSFFLSYYLYLNFFEISSFLMKKSSRSLSLSRFRDTKCLFVGDAGKENFGDEEEIPLMYGV